MSTRATTASQPIGWLRKPGFDPGFIIGATAVAAGSGALSEGLLAVVYRSINFHRYIVDSPIRKVRTAPMRKTPDLPT